MRVCNHGFYNLSGFINCYDKQKIKKKEALLKNNQHVGSGDQKLFERKKNSNSKPPQKSTNIKKKLYVL